MKKIVAGWMILAIGVLLAQADDWKCVICGKPIVREARLVVDQITGETNRVCLDCAKLDRCFDCGLPVRPGEGLKLQDGRILCARDSRDVVTSDDAAKEVCQDTVDGMDRLLSRYMTFPEKNVELSVVDKFHLENLFSAPGFHADGSTVYGATASNPLKDGTLVHTVDVLSYLGKPRLQAVCAHEYTHTWLNENLSPSRKATLDRNSIEGFCELVAYKFMESRQDAQQMKIILNNTYTRGQVKVLLAADAKYGFNTVVEWIEHGDDIRLENESLDRVRAVRDRAYSPATAPSVAWAPVPTAPLTAVPSTLVLKGISGTEQRRFALINNSTFEKMEHGSVRVGQTNVSLRCLEIQKDSVIVQLDGSKDKLQLFLRESK